MPCRGCDYNTQHEMAGRPFSFHRQPEGGGAPAFAERDWPTLKATLDRLRAGVSDKEIETTYHDVGLNKLYFALDPEYLPHIDPCKIAPQARAHLTPSLPPSHTHAARVTKTSGWLGGSWPLA